MVDINYPMRKNLAECCAQLHHSIEIESFQLLQEVILSLQDVSRCQNKLFLRPRRFQHICAFAHICSDLCRRLSAFSRFSLYLLHSVSSTSLLFCSFFIVILCFIFTDGKEYYINNCVRNIPLSEIFPFNLQKCCLREQQPRAP